MKMLATVRNFLRRNLRRSKNNLGRNTDQKYAVDEAAQHLRAEVAVAVPLVGPPLGDDAGDLKGQGTFSNFW